VRRLLRRHWFAFLAVAGIAALLVAVDPAKVAGVMRRIDWRPALLMVPVTIAMYAIRSAAWWLALRKIGSHITLLRCLAVEFAGQVMVFLPLGDLSRVAMAHRVDPRGPSTGKIAGTVTFQELLYMTLIGLGVLPRLASHRDVAILFLGVSLAQIIVFTILLWKPAYRRALALVERIPVFRRFDQPLRRLQPTFVSLFTPSTFVPVVLLEALAVLLTYLLFFLALQALGQSQVTFIAAAFVLSVSYIASAVSFLPGGVAAFEGLITVLMIANGVPAAVGAAAGLLFRAYNDGLMAIVGAGAGFATRAGARRRAPSRRRSAVSAQHR
jgi:uncharacterized membrane protein YbhN (UPF0104 family)